MSYEHPLCTICDPPRRHPLREPHKFPDSPIMVADQTPIGSKVEIKPIARVPIPKKSAVEETGCPVCAERRRKQVEATKRWREKKK